MLLAMLREERSPFFQHFAILELHPFGRDDALSLLQDHRPPDCPIAPEVAARAVCVLGGRPFYLQMLGEALTARRRTPDLADLKAALQEMVFSRTGRLGLYFENEYHRLVGRATSLAATLGALAAMASQTRWTTTGDGLPSPALDDGRKWRAAGTMIMGCGAGKETTGGARHLHTPDTELVRRARDGDETACREMVDCHSDYLYRMAFSLVGNAADAADVLQETFAGAFRRLREFEERSSVKTWLSRILVRQAARHHRTRQRRRTVPLNGGPDVPGEPRAGGIADSAEAASDARIDVTAALETLTPEHREVIVLRELQGMSYEEIAEVVAAPRGTVESRLFRARQILRDGLRDYLK